MPAKKRMDKSASGSRSTPLHMCVPEVSIILPTYNERENIPIICWLLMETLHWPGTPKVSKMNSGG